jgi:hypothetical protein
MSVSSRFFAWSHVAIVAAAVCVGLADARSAAAQDKPPIFTLNPVSLGDCKVVVKIQNPRGGDQIGVVVDQTLLREQTVTAGGGTLTFGLSDPLRVGALVRVRLNGSNTINTGAVAELTAKVADKPGAKAPEACEAEAEPDDESPFEASAFLGEVIDNFAPDAVGNYKYSDPDALKSKGSFIFGFNFDYRLHGRSDSRVQWWVEGETMHGVRTADVDCAPSEQKPPVCDTATLGNVTQQAKFILKNATSLEVWASPRVEFHTLQGGTDSPAKLYAALVLGFIALDDAPQNGVYRSHHVGLGLAADAGSFRDSYLEVGWGKNELFSKDWDRLKISGLLSFSLERIPLWRDLGRVFVEMTIDNSLGDGPDSIRTFFGVDIDLKKGSQ